MPLVWLDGEAGPLEAALEVPETEPRLAVLLCHPHPPSGGTMNTHAVVRAMRAFRDRGCAVLRFNFRGVGRSAGGDRRRRRGARGRARRARLARAPLSRAAAGGGGLLVRRLGRDACRCGWRRASLAGPRGAGVALELRGGWPTGRPKAFVLADRDEFTDVPAMEGLVAAMAPPAHLWIVEGTTHLFTERLDAYQEVVDAAAGWILEALAKRD